jgi:hypothetical protein
MEASSTGSSVSGSAGFETGVFFLSGPELGRDLEPISSFLLLAYQRV